MTFKDHFSGHAIDYAKFRPHYPDSLFQYLAGICATRRTAWDCATGNGQAARPLAEFFDQVIATDASENQIGRAEQHPRIKYRVAAAERSGLPSRSVDLITVAQALHWFELESFYAEAKRVLRPNGAIAIWCYNLLQITPEIDAGVNRFYRDIVGPYWPSERKLIEEQYRTIPFPFTEIDPPPFAMRALWSLPDLVGYLRTWSATQAFIAANKVDPIGKVADELSAGWGDSKLTRKVVWPLTVRVGREVSKNS